MSGEGLDDGFICSILKVRGEVYLHPAVRLAFDCGTSASVRLVQGPNRQVSSNRKRRTPREFEMYNKYECRQPHLCA
jgi:hypothetical protein